MTHVVLERLVKPSLRSPIGFHCLILVDPQGVRPNVYASAVILRIDEIILIDGEQMPTFSVLLDGAPGVPKQTCVFRGDALFLDPFSRN